MRLVITLLLLVVLPTGLLSVLAGRSIQAREVILHRRLEQDAIRQIDAACETVRGLLLADTAHVRDTFRATVLSGMDAGGFARAVEALQGQCAFVKHVYLFMNPWGFVYPNIPDAAAEMPLSADYLLRQDLINLQSSGGRSLETNLSLRREGRIYYFSPVPGFSELISGFEINVDVVMKRLEAIVVDCSTEVVELRIVAVEGRARSEDAVESDVQVSDSFSIEPDRARRRVGAECGGGEGALAAGWLPDPFVHVQLAAFLVHEDDLRRAEALEARLIGWGILLLAVVITVSSTILIRRTMNQAALTRRRSEFVIGMSHDLRTPVASMRVLADSLCAGRVQDPEKQKHFLRTIASECERLGDMIERILFFFCQEQRAISYTMSLFAVRDMVSHTVTAYRDRLQGRVSIALKICESPTTVEGDAEALAKVVTNLLDNAVKYGVVREGNTDPHASDIEVGLGVAQRRGRDWIVITVADHGPGIPLHEHNKVFERFYRHDSEAHRHVGGIGLGLSLCTDIVKAHRGRITLDNRQGGGVVFSVWLRSKSKI